MLALISSAPPLSKAEEGEEEEEEEEDVEGKRSLCFATPWRERETREYVCVCVR